MAFSVVEFVCAVLRKIARVNSRIENDMHLVLKCLCLDLFSKFSDPFPTSLGLFISIFYCMLNCGCPGFQPLVMFPGQASRFCRRFPMNI